MLPTTTRSHSFDNLLLLPLSLCDFLSSLLTHLHQRFSPGLGFLFCSLPPSHISLPGWSVAPGTFAFWAAVLRAVTEMQPVAACFSSCSGGYSSSSPLQTLTHLTVSFALLFGWRSRNRSQGQASCLEFLVRGRVGPGKEKKA